MAKKVRVTETVLRDAHQSLLATRMKIEDMIPILSKMNEVGFNSVECWGGATFDSCLRFLSEDPWERLRTLRREMPDTRLQMLFRGQNMLGYRHYADDVLQEFVKKSVENGIDVIRIFDALNDIRNLQTAISSAKKASRNGKKPEVQVAISYTTGEVFTTEYYVEYAKKIANAGADSICIKDMAALLTPYKCEELVKALKANVDLPIDLHTHYTSGLASMCLLKGIEAGADIIDTAMSPLALGTSHAPTESMVAALQGTKYDTGIDLMLLTEIREYFMQLRKKYIDEGLIDQKMLATDAGALIYQVPGGMLSNLLSQLKQAGKEDLLNEVLLEVPRVRKDAGYPPLVTPSSQIVGTQAVFNVLMGERYKTVTKEFKGVVRGEYGQTPVPIDPEFRKKIIGNEKPIDCRPADLLEPELEKLRKECAEWAESEEDVLSYAQFGQVAVKFFEKRRDKKFGLDSKHGDSEKQVHPV
ncbi:MAG: oxaloacetate decarboxylase subunit alpha [Oscillospiraceae bacterium]|nr:oxaloacetate decarboxylase subunit alpha [Oscillospiraceae bacterium]